MGEREKKAKNIPFARLKIITAADSQNGFVLILQVAQPILARIFCVVFFSFSFLCNYSMSVLASSMDSYGRNCGSVSLKAAQACLCAAHCEWVFWNGITHLVSLLGPWWYPSDLSCSCSVLLAAPLALYSHNETSSGDSPSSGSITLQSFSQSNAQ